MVLAMWAGKVVLSTGRSNRGSYYQYLRHLRVGNQTMRVRGVCTRILPVQPDKSRIGFDGCARSNAWMPVQIVGTDQMNALGI